MLFVWSDHLIAWGQFWPEARPGKGPTQNQLRSSIPLTLTAPSLLPLRGAVEQERKCEAVFSRRSKVG